MSSTPKLPLDASPQAGPTGQPSQDTPNLQSRASPETEAETVKRLASLKPTDYDRIRKEEAKALGIQIKTLDEMVKAARNGGSAERTPFTDHEPAEDAVDPAWLLTEIATVIRVFIVLEPEQADAAALWVVHTYLTDVAEVSPIVIINAPERACAKTLFQTVLGRMCHRPLPASNASLSALFRAAEHWNPTLLIDEADTFFKDSPELHGMVNAGYQKGGYVLRSEPNGDSFEPRMFPVYGAKSIAGITLEKHLPDSTMSRGIVLNMRRKLPHEKVARMRHADMSVFERLGPQLVRFANDYSQQVRLARPPLPDELSDRAQDNWEPLLAIAQVAGPEWLERGLKAALKMSAASESMTSTSNELLGDIKEVLDGWHATKIKTKDLLEKLCEDEDKGWLTYNRGRPLTPRQLAKQLDLYGIHPKTVRQSDGSTPKGYEVAQFDDAFRRYLKVKAAEPDSGPTQGLGDHAHIGEVAATAQPQDEVFTSLDPPTAPSSRDESGTASTPPSSLLDGDSF
jgi:putative DNA primase/helicase